MYHLCIIPNSSNRNKTPFGHTDENRILGKFETNQEWRKEIADYLIHTKADEVFTVLNDLPKNDNDFISSLRHRGFLKIAVLVNGIMAHALVAYWSDDDY